MDKLTLRASQEAVLRYQKGLMGISAVPGSGKTWTLSQLAAKLILEKELEPDQEILVVTFSNSAANNFASRISLFLGEAGLLEGIGYRVRTLHALANDILRVRPEIVGISERYSILDEEEAKGLRNDLINLYLIQNPNAFAGLMGKHISAKKLAEIRKKELPGLLNDLATAYIRTVKDHQLNSDQMKTLLDAKGFNSELLEFGQQIFQGYQAALNYRGAVDFDDLISLASQCLRSDKDLLLELRHRWPIILEDEAQDSSQLQEEILSLLTGEDGNWVRVGDPNQAIYASFTTANPNLLKRYLARESVLALDLPESGRSSLPIIQLANRLILWVQNSHPNMWVRDALSMPLIIPTKEGDPQANPPAESGAVELVRKKMTPNEEADFLIQRAKSYLEKYPERTAAVLAFNNTRVANLADKFKDKGIDVVDTLMRLPDSTRSSVGTISLILAYLYSPLEANRLGKLFTVFHRNEREDPTRWRRVEELASLISSCSEVENYLFPEDGRGWLDSIKENLNDTDLHSLEQFKQVVRSWLYYSKLPMDQLILLLAQDLDLDPFELATEHQVSLLIKDTQNAHPDWNVELLIEQLKKIARNTRAFRVLSENESGFDPDLYPGKLVVCTLHKAKGLEWDKVFLTSVNDYDFPSGSDSESYRGEPWYAEGRQNPQAQMLSELKSIIQGQKSTMKFAIDPLIEARYDLARERLRLLYVGITRARRSVTITWNTGNMNNSNPALALQALWEESGD